MGAISPIISWMFLGISIGGGSITHFHWSVRTEFLYILHHAYSRPLSPRTYHQHISHPSAPLCRLHRESVAITSRLFTGGGYYASRPVSYGIVSPFLRASGLNAQPEWITMWQRGNCCTRWCYALFFNCGFTQLCHGGGDRLLSTICRDPTRHLRARCVSSTSFSDSQSWYLFTTIWMIAESAFHQSTNFPPKGIYWVVP